MSCQIPELSTFRSVLRKALSCLPSCPCAFLQLPQEHPSCSISLHAAYHPEAVLSYWENRFDTFLICVVISVSLHHMTGATRPCFCSKCCQSYIHSVATQTSRRTWAVYPGTTRIVVRSITNASQSLANALVLHNSPPVLAMLYHRGCDLDTIIHQGRSTCRSACS